MVAPMPSATMLFSAAFSIAVLLLCSQLVASVHSSLAVLPTHYKRHSTSSLRRLRLKGGAAKGSVTAAAAAAASAAPAQKKASLLRAIGPVLASSFCAAALMYPLDLVRALQMANAGSGLSTKQLLVNFKNTHGYKGFVTQGLLPEVIKATWARFVKFSMYPIAHLAITGMSDKHGNAFTKAMAGTLASIPEVFTIVPLEIAKLQLQLDSTKRFNNNMFAAMTSVFEERGAQGFLVGYTGIQLRQSVWTAAYFASIAFFERQVDSALTLAGLDKSVSQSNSKAVSQILSGFLAGVFGAALNTPCDTVRSIVQKRIFTGPAGSSATFFGVGAEVLRAKGAGALWAGFKFKAFHLGGGGALMAILVPTFKEIFDKLGD